MTNIVTVENSLLVASNIIFALNWYTVRVRFKRNVMRAWIESWFALVFFCSSQYHMCLASDINFCPQNLSVLLAMDTYSTYMAVPATFAVYYLIRIGQGYMLFMTVFNYILMLIFMDSFWTVFIVVPISAIPFLISGEMKYSIFHPRQRWKSFLSSIFGVASLYFRYMAGTDTSAQAYLEWHSAWHIGAGLSAQFFIMDTDAGAVEMYELVIRTDFDALQNAAKRVVTNALNPLNTLNTLIGNNNNKTKETATKEEQEPINLDRLGIV